MSGIAPRDPAADARWTRRGFITFGAVAASALIVAAGVLVASRAPDHEYTYILTFTEDAGHPYTLLLPLPADGQVDSACRFLGNQSAPARDGSTYGEVLRVEGVGDLSVMCTLPTFEPLSLAFSTEGHSARGQLAVRVFLNASGFAQHPTVDLSYREAGPQWTTTRYVQGNLEEGWTTIEIREVLQPTPEYRVPPTT